MAVANFSFPFQLATPSTYGFYDSHQTPRSAVGDLRLNAEPPPTPPPRLHDAAYNNHQPYITSAHYQQQHQQRQKEQYSRTQESYAVTSGHVSRYANYNQDFRRTQPREQQIHQQQQQQRNIEESRQTQHQSRSPIRDNRKRVRDRISESRRKTEPRNSAPENYPELNNDGYTRVNGGAYGSADAKTSVHAILDYDDDGEDAIVDDYYDQVPSKNARFTPIQGAIDLRNGSVPVVPLYPYPQLNNGSFFQIPILWSALSIALGAELRGDLVKGIPCIKKHHQLYCPTAGKTYPNERIEHFIDENKALMKRMYGVFEMDDDYGPPNHRRGETRKRSVNTGPPDGGPKFGYPGEAATPVITAKRNQTININMSESGRVDACESKTEIFTPYWAKNSAQKLRAIVNTQHFEQAIHQEVCSKSQTNRCRNDCGCEQKYKWHRLLAYDPDDDCKGIFMDWFIFPSCCVCRCDPDNAIG